MMHTNGPEPGARERVKERAMNVTDNPILAVCSAQVYDDELQVQVYRQGCDGESTYSFVSQADLVSYLNMREASKKAINAPASIQLVICVDFDGTLCDHEFPGIGKMKDGARAALTLFREWGYRVVIWTCRTCHWNYDVFGGNPATPTADRPSVIEMTAWLKANGIPYDEIDDGSRGKPLADFYIDDKGIRFANNWGEIITFVAHNGILKRPQ